MCKEKSPLTDDWRRHGQEKYLKNVILARRCYKPFREEWNHDHCEFCGAKFLLNLDELQQGYSTLDGYRWICESCFDDFQCEFLWIVEN